MSAKPPLVGMSNVRSVVGWLWTILLLFGLAFTEYKMAPRDALDLGEDGFGYAIFFGAPLYISVFVTAIVWLGIGTWRLHKKHPDRWLPWIRLSGVMLLVCAIAVKRQLCPSSNPITPESEPIYLAIASAAREQLSGKNIGNIAWLDPEHDLSEIGSSSDSVRKRFDLMVPSCWPRYLLMIRVDGDCVVLARGSGMLGMVGVRIYDHGPVVLYSDVELRKNPYLPRQKRITDRLWFFTSD